MIPVVAVTVRKPLADLLTALEVEAVVWLRLAADASSGQWTLRLLELITGAAPPNWHAINWRYPDYVFLAREFGGAEVAGWLRDTAIPVDGLSISTSFQPEVQGERRESGWGTNSSEPLAWPFQEWQLWQSESVNNPVSHELVAEHLPYFATPDIPLTMLLGVPYTGFNLHGREFLWREQDTSGRLASVRIDAAEISVTVEGDDLEGAIVELSSTEPGPTAEVTSSGDTVRLPLRGGLPNLATVVLRSSDRWLDLRGLGWGRRELPPGVEFVVPSGSRLEALVSAGEGSTTEFKERLPAQTDEGRRKVMKTVAAFANGDGGTLLFGITKDGAICGLPPEEDTAEARDTLTQLVKSWVSPLPRFEIETIPLPDDPARHVVGLSVEAGTQPPYAAGTGPDRMTYYVRRGATTFSVMPDEVRALALRTESAPQSHFPRPLVP
jgi:hypothetical protein